MEASGKGKMQKEEKPSKIEPNTNDSSPIYCLNNKMSPSSIRAEQNQIHEEERERRRVDIIWWNRPAMINQTPKIKCPL
jgi:hypothetical protein